MLKLIILIFLTQHYASTKDTLNRRRYRQKVESLKKQTKKRREERRELDELVKDSFYDNTKDYSRFLGRVTDRDDTATIFKVYSSNRNIKFFRSGDPIYFYPASREEKFCQGHVRSREKNYFTLYAKDISKCWRIDKYFRRGTLVRVWSPVLADRVRDASIHRVTLLKRRKSFLRQLNDINHFTWSYDQQRINLASEYDKKILELKNQKREALDSLMKRKSESANLQQTLSYRLDHIDEDLDFYRIEPDISRGDRWNDDHDLGLPVTKRPQSIIEIKERR